MKRPIKKVSFLKVVKKNLFSTWLDSIISLTIIYLLIKYIPELIRWVIIDANFVGTSRDDCTGEGACWVFIQQRFYQFIYGFYPKEHVWRINLSFVYFFSFIGLLVFPSFKLKSKLVAFFGALLPIFIYVLMNGGSFDLPKVSTHQWGGLVVTLIISTVGIICSLPLGILLALGRQSHMPFVRQVCILFIEFWRGVPLITVLFMASVMLPLFLPEGMNFDKLLRCLIGVALFSAAYMAEVVRGGLQAIPKGQYEAAESLGLSYWQNMILIILPQALKKVIPGIVNSFIALFKDTTLVLIVGIFDLLGIVQAALQNAEWLGYSEEGYLFAGALFWVFCFTMSRYSQRLEKKLNTSH